MKQNDSAGYGWLAAAAAMILAPPVLADTTPAAARPVVLKAAHLFDSISGKLVEHGVVVVEGTKI
jgi:hypothetical protein